MSVNAHRTIWVQPAIIDDTAALDDILGRLEQRLIDDHWAAGRTPIITSWHWSQRPLSAVEVVDAGLDPAFGITVALTGEMLGTKP